MAYGVRVGDHVLAWSGKDNYKQTRSFPALSIEKMRTHGSQHRRPMDAVEPHWSKIRTFLLLIQPPSSSQPSNTFLHRPQSRFYKEAKEVHDVG